MFTAIIFDMDGVLAETSEVNERSYRPLLANYGINLTPEERSRDAGRSLKDKYCLWQERHHVRFKESFEEFMEQCDAAQQAIFQEVLKPDQDFLTHLQTLKEQGIKLAVATSSTKERAIKILELVGVWNYLDAFVNAEDVKNHKPAPDLFLEAAKRLGEEPKDCIVIEDAVNGIQAAKAANMRAIAKITMYHGREEFDEADDIINELSELKETLKQF